MPTYDVVSVPFPYVERPIIKRRPAVIVSSEALHNENDLVWVCMITSKENAGWSGDIEIGNLDIAGLKHPSVIRPSKVATVEATSIKIIGKLEAITADKLQDKISEYLDMK